MSAVSNPDDMAALIRASVERTAQEGTARLGFRHYFQLALHDALAAKYPAVSGLFGQLDTVNRRARKTSGEPKPLGELGQIDFRNNRSMYNFDRSGHNFWLFVDGAAFIGKPGAWFAYTPDRAGLLGVDGPFWVMALLAATVEAHEVGSEVLDGARCRHYRGFSNLVEAQSKIKHPLAPLRFNARSDPSRLPVEVWLDDAKRIRRAALVDTPRPGFEEWSELELSGFGEVPPIPAPPVQGYPAPRSARRALPDRWPRFTLQDPRSRPD